MLRNVYYIFVCVTLLQPRYIHQLMKAMEDRKKEQERREERKIQKEREAEGEQFADKEAYVTSAYKKKLQEQKEEEEREKRQAALEGMAKTSQHYVVFVRKLSLDISVIYITLWIIFCFL